MNRPNRSEIIRGTVTLALLLTVAFSGVRAAVRTLSEAKSWVITVRSPKAVDNRGQADAAEIQAMLEQGLRALSGKATAGEAWMTLGLKPKDIVGVKINCNNWTINLSPQPELVAVLADSLSSVVPLNNIVFYDMHKADLEQAGFKRNATKNGVRFLAAETDARYDDREKLTEIATSLCTKLINFASLKTVYEPDADEPYEASLHFKNQIGSLTAEHAPKCHDDADFLAAILARPSIRQKTILNLCTGLRASYKRGVPWYWGGIILGVDPLATEYVALQVINEKRTLEKAKPLGLSPYLTIAETKYGLGSCLPEKIEWVRLER